MKKLILSALVFLFAATTFAQEGELDTKWTNYMVETERRMIFDEAMDLESPKKEAFWKIYDEYEKELEGFRTSYMTDLKKYAEEYATMTDEQANELIASSFKRKMGRMKLQKKYHAQIVKMVDAKTAARFVQLDDAISMLLRLSVMDEIPFIGDY
ncbi:hypothetical protein O3Q51_13370 [Cryomorphaceae bacterium 1068]|nr:hypothetical protein [Cryomorphaceae bacterium 1068]